MKEGYAAATPHRVHPSDPERRSVWPKLLVASALASACVVSVGMYWPVEQGNRPPRYHIAHQSGLAPPPTAKGEQKAVEGAPVSNPGATTDKVPVPSASNIVATTLPALAVTASGESQSVAPPPSKPLAAPVDVTPPTSANRVVVQAQPEPNPLARPEAPVEVVQPPVQIPVHAQVQARSEPEPGAASVVAPRSIPPSTPVAALAPPPLATPVVPVKERNPFSGLKPSTRRPVLPKPEGLDDVLLSLSSEMREHYLTYTNRQWQLWMENLEARTPAEREKRINPLARPLRTIFETQMLAYQAKVECLTCIANPQDPLCSGLSRERVAKSCDASADYLGGSATPVANVVKLMGIEWVLHLPSPADQVQDIAKEAKSPALGVSKGGAAQGHSVKPHPKGDSRAKGQKSDDCECTCDYPDAE